MNPLPQVHKTIQTPKQRFQGSADNIAKHREMLEDRTFQRAIDYALMEYNLRVSRTVTENPGSAAFAGLKLCGAEEFIQVLKLLSETVVLPAPPQTPNLDHKV